jgi:hypothetical protein
MKVYKTIYDTTTIIKKLITIVGLSVVLAVSTGVIDKYVWNLDYSIANASFVFFLGLFLFILKHGKKF